jgi:4'-phosphopantetheinyl transferase
MTTNHLITQQLHFFSSTANHLAWECPPLDLKLKTGEAHVWLARLDEENSSELKQLLSSDELARADRFRFERDRRRFIAARANLRIILAKYLDENSQRIRFEYNKYGKPFIAANTFPEIKFNVSHSGDLALFAVASGREIGVDIEMVDSFQIDAGMLDHCLTRRELAHFQTLSTAEQKLFFFDCWTRKEALLKACGNGLSGQPPNEIEIQSRTEISMRIADRGLESRPARWAFKKLPSIPGCSAALAIENTIPQPEFRQQASANCIYKFNAVSGLF